MLWPWKDSSGGPLVAVVLCEGAVGLHAGILYQDPHQQTRVLHLAWHHQLRDDPHDEHDGWLGITPLLDEIDQRVLLGACRSVAKHRAALQLPYGFRYQHSRLDQDGNFIPGPGESGLTCATFVLAVFRMAALDLLDLPSWEQRPAERVNEDDEAQRTLIAYLQRKYPAQAEALQQEKGCARFRSEEVAAASAQSAFPVSYEIASRVGALLKTEFDQQTPHAPTP
jgi:hypothetical protein